MQQITVDNITVVFNGEDTMPPREKAIIVDIDGTVADSSKRAIHLEGKKDWDSFFKNTIEDDPIEPVCEIVRRMASFPGYKVIYLTGRPESLLEDTSEWLVKHNLAFDNLLLLMRPEGDFKPSHKFKAKAYEDLIQGKYEVLFALEDDKRCVDMFRKKGVFCLEVGTC